MSNYTSPEISKIIHECVPEVEIPRGQWEQECEWVGGYDGHSRVTNEYPKYRLDDVMRAVKVWGEKQGYNELKWKCENYNPRANERGERGCASLQCEYAGWKDVNELCHDLLTAFLPSLSMQSKEVEDIIKETFKK